jgi:release factor glutamine methyltransferase
MTPSTPIKTVLSLAITQLKAQNFELETTKLEAQLLLQHVLNVNRAWLISHQNDVLEANIHAAYRALINRRLNGEPIAYMLCMREFYGLNLKVTPATLIPRPDTETLVDAALAKIPLQKNLNICDLGTGSGAIALAIAKHRPQAYVLALDASQEALDVAIENAKSLKIPNVKFIVSDWFSALSQQNNTHKFDVIVSNPPYIEANDDHLSQGDLRFEPLSALASGQDGLEDIRKIIKQAPQYLNPHGWLLLEHGYHQADSVAALLKNAEFTEIEAIKDLGGNDRVTLGKISGLPF